MPLKKVCVHCSASVNVRKSACACGHVFASKKSSPLVTMKSKRVAMDSRRSLESEDEIATRKSKDSLRKAKKRASGEFLQSDRTRAAKKRALETQDVTLHRQESDRARTAEKRASETLDMTLESDRARTAEKRASGGDLA